MKTNLEKYLELVPEARERRFKDKHLVQKLAKKYNLDVDEAKLVDLVKDYTSLDRYWRMILKERPELQGSDYNDKKILEQEKVLELEYEMGYKEDIKPKEPEAKKPEFIYKKVEVDGELKVLKIRNA